MPDEHKIKAINNAYRTGKIRQRAFIKTTTVWRIAAKP
jgi:hypothetical protein